MRSALVVLLLFLPIAAGGFLLLRVANGLQSEAQMAAGLKQTSGRLLTISIMWGPSVARGSHSNYSADARYTFEVDGREYTGNGIFGIHSSSLDGLKEELKPWLNDPYATVTEHPDSWTEAFSYAPIAETVPVYYDAAEPTRSYFGTPSAEQPPRGVMSVFAIGMLLFGLGGAALVIYSGIDDRRHARDVNRRRAGDAAAAATGVAPPSIADTREFTRLAVVAIRAIEVAMAGDSAYNRLDSALDSLRQMRDHPDDALLHTEQLGFTRWLSGEWDLETWGPHGEQILAAVNALELFHHRWRAASRTRLIAV